MTLAKINPSRNYMFKVNNRKTRTKCEICSKLIKTLEWRHSCVCIVNFEHISHLLLVFLLLKLSRQMPAGNLHRILKCWWLLRRTGEGDTEVNGQMSLRNSKVLCPCSLSNNNHTFSKPSQRPVMMKFMPFIPSEWILAVKFLYKKLVS